MLELLSEFVVLSEYAFNDRLLLFLLSFRSLSLLTLLLPFDGDEVALIVLASITAGRCGNEILRIFSSCLRSKRELPLNYLDLEDEMTHLSLHPLIFVN